jgi:acetyl/propionyl-CoA carboxylase alpha subunit
VGKNRQIKRILIANRSEIAVRIIQTCKEMGIETVTAYCPADKGSLFTLMSDFSHAFDSNDLHSTYLNQDTLVALASKYECDAIHPGYGFLSENADFAQLCQDNNICFIGPSPEHIRLMGDKISARHKVTQLGIPLLPSLKIESLKNIKDEVSKIGYPIIIKAAAGGGGRGMRLVEDDATLEREIKSAKSEAKAAFADETVYIEKYLQKCRHIEVQVFGDSHGNSAHLFERECSIQRRHQKVIEEAPSSALTETQRQEICDTALKIVNGIKYKNAGTIEFLWSEGDFYFLEMNTRIQVEHAVTEMITGVDIVKAQIEVAEGKPLNQDILKAQIHGHAIEARIYAENPQNNYLPTQGTIQSIGSCNIPSTRVETSFLNGLKVPLEFDSMLAKVCAWNSDRTSATQRLIQALENLPFSGIINNRNHLIEILHTDNFNKGNTTTDFLNQFNSPPPPSVSPEVIAAFLLNDSDSLHPSQSTVYNPWLSHE